MRTPNDGWGDQQPDDGFETLAHDTERWLYRTASVRLGVRANRIEDVVQEGRIALWRAWTRLAEHPDRTVYAMRLARQRMKEFAWRYDTPPTGQPPGPRYEVRHGTSIDRQVADGVEALLSSGDLLSGVEVAYHRGEIMAAIDRLTPRQKRYVYARFWCGMDPDGMHMNPGMRQARDANPDLRRDILWTGSKTTPGAKGRLVAELGHLHALVASL